MWGKQLPPETENSHVGKIIYIRVLMFMYVEYATVAVITVL
jgi:hypothetical protein